MTKEEKIAFCEFIRAVKFPDGYAANLAKCVSADGCKLARPRRIRLGSWNVGSLIGKLQELVHTTVRRGVDILCI
jgi:hypothetical protein